MIEKAHCTICAAVESPGFYTGCMFADGNDCNGWKCDGKGNLTRDGGAWAAAEFERGKDVGKAIGWDLAKRDTSRMLKLDGGNHG